jgi:hypothetical protein
MRHEFREGDWVRHHSCPEPIRVVGIGTTIVVQFPSGDMQAFELCELQKVQIAKVPVRKVAVQEYRQDHGRGSAEHFVLVTFTILLYLIMLAWWLIAGVGR